MHHIDKHPLPGTWSHRTPVLPTSHTAHIANFDRLYIYDEGHMRKDASDSPGIGIWPMRLQDKESMRHTLCILSANKRKQE